MHWLALVLLIALAQSARIQWTGQGGTNLWDNGRNWDCNCLPTANDDVLIAFTLGPASIRIGTPARAKSLTIGGTQTQFFQTLTVSGSLIIGDGTLNTNGILQVETAPTSPFNVSGVFSVNGKGFGFTSGLVGGNGTIRLLAGAAMNFTGPAAKEFGGGVTLSIEGDAGIYSSTGSSIFLKESSNIKVTGTLTSKTALDIVVNNKASFTTSGNGQLKFDPTSASAKLILQGAILLDKWTVTQGAIMVLGKLTSGALTLGPTAQLQLVGGPDEQRTFVSVSGGTVLQQGGASEFKTVGGSTHTLASLTVTGGALAVSGNLNVDRLTVNGGIITGPNLINAKSAFVSFALFQNQGGLSIINSVELTGQVTVDNSRIVALQSSQVRVAADSQLIFIGPQSSVTFRGQVFQNAPLKLVRATFTGAPPTFLVENTASWTTDSLLNSLGVPITGLGVFSLDTTGRFDFSNADFSASTFASKGSFTFQQGNFSFQSVTGSGLFVGAPQKFNATTFTASNFSLIDGSANLTKSNVNYVLVNNGQLSVTDATLGTFDWKGGLFSGTGGNPQATVSSLQVSGIPAKTLQSCVMTVTGLSLTCGPTQCAFFTKDATLKTK